MRLRLRVGAPHARRCITCAPHHISLFYEMCFYIILSLIFTDLSIFFGQNFVKIYLMLIFICFNLYFSFCFFFLMILYVFYIFFFFVSLIYIKEREKKLYSTVYEAKHLNIFLTYFYVFYTVCRFLILQLRWADQCSKL